MVFSECKFITEIPDISRISNLEKLYVFHCESLVTVHDSVGFLDKLIALSFVRCYNLTSFPTSLRLRSLEYLDLQHCLRLQNFPEIQCEMKYLHLLYLDNIAIKELPSSIMYFTGLYQLSLKSCENLVHLPSSILQLQHLKFLTLNECSKLVKLPTKEKEIPSSTVLFSSPPPVNSDIFNDGCSSIGFPALGDLALENCTRLSKSDFIATLDCFSTLFRLNLSRSDVVSVPACIKRFVSLRTLQLEDCKQLQEILDLPPNLEEIFAKGCISLESFPQVSEEYQFNTSELPTLFTIDLSECYKMHVNIPNLLANSLLGKVCLSDLSLSLSLSCVFMGYTLKIHDIRLIGTF
jgi:hypothetical protein